MAENLPITRALRIQQRVKSLEILLDHKHYFGEVSTSLIFLKFFGMIDSLIDRRVPLIICCAPWEVVDGQRERQVTRLWDHLISFHVEMVCDFYTETWF
jgi:hypothetical protein